MSHDEHDPTAARLRAALNAEASMVQPDDQLSSIRERTEGGARQWWQRPGVLAVAAAVVLGLAVGGAAALLGGGDDPDVVVGGKGSASPTPSESSTPSETPSTSEGTATPTSAPTDDVWVYYVMNDGDLGPRLYREQHSIGTQGDMDAARSAVREMLSGDPQDPDYASQWPQGTELRGWTVHGDTATVDLSQFTTEGSGAEGVAVQQLVYTVTANDPAISKVRITVDGKTPVADNDWSRPVPRSPRMDIQGLIWLLTPTQGSTVSSPVAITGYGTAFEGTISWEVRRDGSDEVVADGFTQGGSMGEFAEFADSVELAAGSYEMRAFESSAENGEPIHVDSKTFTVE